MMKKMYFTGYWTTGKSGRPTMCSDDKLKVGKLYLVEEYSYWHETKGHDDARVSTYLHAYRVFDPKTRKVLSNSERIGVFKPDKKCKRHELSYLSDRTSVMQCHNCFRKFRERLVPVDE
jgi:hypothetical protein